MTQLDRRYSIAPEWCGYPEKRYVPRFCGEWIRMNGGQVPACLTISEARAHCVAFERERQKKIEAISNRVRVIVRGEGKLTFG
jgi:hypothetical protein